MRVVSLRASAAESWPEGTLSVSPAQALRFALFLLITGNIGRIPVLDLGDRAAPLLVNDLGVLGVLAIGAIAMAQARSIRLNDVAVAGLVFAGIGALSAVWGVQRFGFSALEVAGSLAYLARWMVYFALYVVIINCVRSRDVEGLWGALETTMLIIVAFGIVQAVFLPNFAFMVYPDAREAYDWDSQRNRLVSTILEPNVVSGMIVSTLLVQLSRLASGARMPLWKPTLMFTGLVMTLSRGGMLSFVVGCTVLISIHGMSRKLARFAAVIGVLILAALPRLLPFANEYRRFSITDNSAIARVMIWQRAIGTFVDYPLFGIGFNTWGFVQERRGIERLGGSAYSAEGGLLFVAVMTGVVGLAAYLAMLWFVLRSCRRNWRDARASAGERGLLTGTAAATVSIIVHSLFVNSLFTPWVMEPLWVLWGLAFVIASDLRQRASVRLTG